MKNRCTYVLYKGTKENGVQGKHSENTVGEISSIFFNLLFQKLIDIEILYYGSYTNKSQGVIKEVEKWISTLELGNYYYLFV